MSTDRIRLAAIHEKAVASYRDGCREAERLVPLDETGFLLSIGLSLQVLFDYAEDFARMGEPDGVTFLRVAEMRRDYFRDVQKGIPDTRIVTEPELPLRSEEWDGIAWLPRITKKAGCFLSGTLDKEVMFGCGGDRAFVRNHRITLPDFLETVGSSANDVAAILRFVRGA